MAKQDKYTAPRGTANGTTTTVSTPQINSVEDTYIPSTDEQLDKVKDIYNNKKGIINVVLGAIALLVIGYFAYQYYQKSQNEDAANAISRASTFMLLDSTALMLKGEGAYMGVEKIADKFSGTKTGNIANYMAGLGNLKQGDFKKAIKYLEAFDGEGSLLTTIAAGSLGDAYWENNQLDKAVASYEKAGSDEKNFQYAPMYLQRAAVIYEKLGKNKEAIVALKKIKEKFRGSNEARDAEKYLAKLGEIAD